MANGKNAKKGGIGSFFKKLMRCNAPRHNHYGHLKKRTLTTPPPRKVTLVTLGHGWTHPPLAMLITKLKVTLFHVERSLNYSNLYKMSLTESSVWRCAKLKQEHIERKSCSPIQSISDEISMKRLHTFCGRKEKIAIMAS